MQLPRIGHTRFGSYKMITSSRTLEFLCQAFGCYCSYGTYIAFAEFPTGW